MKARDKILRQAMVAARPAYASKRHSRPHSFSLSSPAVREPERGDPSFVQFLTRGILSSTQVKPLRTLQFCLVFLFLTLPSVNARADGGIIRSRETQGPFIVTIFTASELVTDQPADISVLVQDRESKEAILDATIDLVFTAPASLVSEPADQICGHSSEALGSQVSGPESIDFTVPATRRQASNKLLYAAAVELGRIGNWQLQAFVQRGSDAVKVASIIPVTSSPRRVTALFPYLALPPLLIALFALHQWLKQTGRRTVLVGAGLAALP